MTIIESKIIFGIKLPPALEKKLRRATQAPKGTAITMCVFQVRVAGQTRYCCWSGGEIVGPTPDPENIRLTLPGRAAMEGLLSLPCLTSKKLIFQELRMGPTPLQQKVIDTFLATTGSQAPIVFFGDLAKELDGQMGPAFNFSGHIELRDCTSP